MIRKNSAAAPIALVMAGICGKNRLIEVDAMTVQKTTLVVDGQFNSGVQKG